MGHSKLFVWEEHWGVIVDQDTVHTVTTEVDVLDGAVPRWISLYQKGQTG